MSVVRKQAMVDYVRALGYDPTAISALDIDATRTGASLVNQPTDMAQAVAFLASQGIPTKDVIRIQMWNGRLTVTRHKRDKYGDVEFAVDVSIPDVKFKEVSEEYEIG